MAKVNAMGLIYTLLLVFVLQFLCPASGLDVTFFKSTTECSGDALVCGNLPPQACCATDGTNGGAVQIASSDSGSAIQLYKDGGCTTQSNTPTGDGCTPGGEWTGVAWSKPNQRRLLSGDLFHKPCTTQMQPNGVLFKEDDNNGHWILTSSRAVELYAELKTFPQDEKVSWLKSQGAVYKAGKKV